MIDELHDVLADPARLLTADRAAVRAHIVAAESAASVGGEVFLQAEAIFGGADVAPAEFASWLHFAAQATGHDEYAGTRPYPQRERHPLGRPLSQPRGLTGAP